MDWEIIGTLALFAGICWGFGFGLVFMVSDWKLMMADLIVLIFVALLIITVHRD